MKIFLSWLTFADIVNTDPLSFEFFSDHQLKGLMDQARRTLLSFGFVRNCCQDQNMDLLPSDIIELLLLWLSFGDRVSLNLSHKSIQVKTIIDDKHGECEQIKKSQTCGPHATAICQNIVKKGDKQLWTFKLTEKLQATSIVMGIIDNNTATNLAGTIHDFSDLSGGYGLFHQKFKKCSTRTAKKWLLIP